MEQSFYLKPNSLNQKQSKNIQNQLLKQEDSPSEEEEDKEELDDEEEDDMIIQCFSDLKKQEKLDLKNSKSR
jgi:hypothetical protein